MSIRKRDVHFSDWTKVRHALVCNNVQGITEASSFDDVRTFLINSESGSNPFYYYVCYIKDTKEIYTHGQFYNCIEYDDSELRELINALEDDINLKADQSDLDILSAEVEENETVVAKALTDLNNRKADKSDIPDVSTLATKTELNLKQDVLSASNFATVNGTSVFGGNNAIVIEEPDHYASGTATVDGSGFVTSVTTNEAGHVTKVSARAITDNDITSISASKITGTINIDNLPTGALERMFVVEDETAAMSATVEEGDVVQVTGNGNKMYFCVRSGATTFSEKFMEFTAGTATSVAWSGITGKPEGIDGWGDRISAVEADYFSSTGGTITGDVANPLTINRTTMDSVGLLLRANNIIKGEFGWASASGTYIYNAPSGGLLGIKDDGTPHFQGNTLLHSGNYSEYAVKKNMGINIAIADNEYGYGYVDGGWPEAGSAMLFGAGNYKAGVQVGALGSAIRYGYTAGTTSFTWRTILDENNYSNYALPITGGAISGNVAIGGTTADEKLHVHGKMVVSGNIKIPGSSDARYSLYSDGGIRFYAPSSGGWSNTWNLFSNDGGTSHGSLCGAFGEGSSLSYLYFGGTWDSPKTVQWPDGTFSIGRGTTKDTGRLNVGGNIRIFGDSNPLIAFSRGSDSARYVQAVSTGLRVGVGGTTNLLIQDDGKCKAVDFITTSDNRLKDFVSDIDLDFEALKLIPKKYYYWKDKSMGEDLQIGTSAQELAKIYPTCVSYDEVSDRYSVNYQKLSIVALAAIDKLHERVSELESKLND